MRAPSESLQAAAAGVVAMAGLEIVRAVLPGAAPRGRGALLVDFALGGLLGALYAQMVPPRAWGARSGSAFAEIPGKLLHSRLTRVEMAVWGGAAGFLLSAAGQPASASRRLRPAA